MMNRMTIFLMERAKFIYETDEHCMVYAPYKGIGQWNQANRLNMFGDSRYEVFRHNREFFDRYEIHINKDFEKSDI